MHLQLVQPLDVGGVEIIGYKLLERLSNGKKKNNGQSIPFLLQPRYIVGGLTAGQRYYFKASVYAGEKSQLVDIHTITASKQLAPTIDLSKNEIAVFL